MGRFSIYCLCSILIGLSPASTAHAEERWLKLTTPNFEIYTTGGEGSARRTLLYFEQIRAFFLEAMKLESKSSEPVRIIGFKNRKQFAPFRPNEFSSAFYLGGHDRDYIVMGSIGAERHETAIHEYVHLLVRHTELRLPPWLNEGFAEFYSTLRTVGDQVQVGAINAGRMRVLYDRSWLPMARLLEVERDSPEYNQRKHAGVFYSQSWAAVHMLNMSEDYRSNTSAFIEEIAHGASGAEALKAAYGQSPEEFEKKLKFYVRGNSFFVSLFDIKLEKSALEPLLEEASELEAELVLAQLQAHVRGSREKTAARYAALAEKYPDDPRIPEALGYLLWRERDREAAVAHMKRAAELGSTNPKLYYDLAGLTRGSEPEEFQIAMLKKVVELKPDDDNARRSLGGLYMRRKQWGMALAQLNQVKKVETGETAFRLYHSRAFGYFRLNDLDNAKQLAERARKYAADPQQTSLIEQLLAAIDYQRTKPEERAVVENREEPPAFQTADEAPRLHRRPAQAGPSEGVEAISRTPRRPSFQGALEAIECGEGGAIMHIFSPEGSRAFALDQMDNVVILGRVGEAEFTCGPQDRQPVRIEYEDPTSEEHAEGRVRLIEFLPVSDPLRGLDGG